MAVASPSTVLLVANIISFTFSNLIRFNKSLIPNSSGPIPSMGDNLPNNTKYLPLKPPVDSMAKTSEGL